MNDDFFLWYPSSGNDDEDEDDDDHRGRPTEHFLAIPRSLGPGFRKGHAPIWYR